MMLMDAFKWWKQTSWKSMKNEYLTDDATLENNIARHLKEKQMSLISMSMPSPDQLLFLLSKNSSTDILGR